MKDSSNFYQVIGLMSGTSLDGLDMAYVQFEIKEGQWHFELGPSQSIDYSEEWRFRLKHSVDLSGLALSLLDREYGRWLGHQTRQFIESNDLRINFIASHGHTVFHQIDKKFTLQIGHGQELATVSGQRVICDFRTKDVVLGGQGAPLVPIGDELLFGEYDYCLNLGGISNVSFRHEGKRKAYDIGLVNMLLNYLTNQIGKAYDKGGELAATGTLNQTLFDELNALPYYQEPFPKSTGYEWFLEQVVPIVDRHSGLPMEDRLCTGVHHITYQIAEAVKSHSVQSGERLWATGGGAKNDFLVGALRDYLGSQVEVITPDESLIEFKEAIVFALMGVLRERGEANCLCSVTGASSDNSGGVVYFP
ncbi:MAG: anhydro-N-acetylmuramic acid kinase [Cytophagales bacterium]|nr:anhydro-N-acetylmuramic acid kinase [Cytophagales bacterium]